MEKQIKSLKGRRMELGLTQQEVATALGIDRSHYCKIENGNRKATLKLATEIVIVLRIKDLTSLTEIAHYFYY